jgi:hypothetical protein
MISQALMQGAIGGPEPRTPLEAIARTLTGVMGQRQLQTAEAAKQDRLIQALTSGGGDIESVARTMMADPALADQGVKLLTQALAEKGQYRVMSPGQTLMRGGDIAYAAPEKAPAPPTGMRYTQGGAGLEAIPGYLEIQKALAEGRQAPVAKWQQETLPGGMEVQRNVRTGEVKGMPKAAGGFEVITDPATGQVVYRQGQAGGGRPLTQQSISELIAQSGSVEQMDRLVGGFKPEYGGYIVNKAGDVANWFGRTFGDPSGGAQWWQDYQSFKNVARNTLFGSALTEPERIEFEKAMVTPGMDPGEIQKNLQRQAAAARSAMRKLGRSLVASGYAKEGVREAMGPVVGSLLEGEPAGGPASEPAKGAKPVGYSVGDTVTGKGGKQYRIIRLSPDGDHEVEEVK